MLFRHVCGHLRKLIVSTKFTERFLPYAQRVNSFSVHTNFTNNSIDNPKERSENTGITKFLCELYKETENNIVNKTVVYEDLQNSLLAAFKPMELKKVTQVLEEIVKTKSDLDDLEKLIKESNNDQEMVTAATNDQTNLEKTLHTLEVEFLELLCLGTRDEADDADMLVELSAGVGGQEAMLFTQEMFNMYQNYAMWKRWTCQVLEYDSTDLGGIRHAILSIAGQGVGQHFKYESGVHRVQRTPQTERSGRIHTSTMAVAVLPRATQIEISLNPKDLKIETKRSSGPGGQHVNRTETCVRIVHLPTGIFAECQMERSQQRNRDYAMQTLAARLHQRELEQRLTQEKNTRKAQVGTASRWEKVRTYNYPQNRITDHRLGKNYHEIEIFLSGQEKLDSMIHELLSKENLEVVQEFFRKYECV